MFKVLVTSGDLPVELQDDYWDWEGTLQEACEFAAWLLERPTARILAGYTVTVVEVEG